MKLSYDELNIIAAKAVCKINAENDIKLKKVKTIYGGEDSHAHAVIYKDNDWNEFRVLQFVDGAHVVKGDYHTDDKDDAESTASYLIKHIG